MQSRRRKHLVLIPVMAILIALSFSIAPVVESIAAEEVKINIAGARVKDPWYAFSQALANFINKKSDWRNGLPKPENCL